MLDLAAADPNGTAPLLPLADFLPVAEAGRARRPFARVSGLAPGTYTATVRARDQAERPATSGLTFTIPATEPVAVRLEWIRLNEPNRRQIRGRIRLRADDDSEVRGSVRAVWIIPDGSEVTEQDDLNNQETAFFNIAQTPGEHVLMLVGVDLIGDYSFFHEGEPLFEKRVID